jgi:hypothetical protein
MKKLFLIIPFLFLASTGCQKEPAEKPAAKIRTNLVNNTVAKQKVFTIYLDQTHGDFITVFKGDSPKKTYKKDDFTVSGLAIESKDSATVTGYPLTGEFTFTLLAVSYGNWGGERLEAIDSIRITVE